MLFSCWRINTYIQRFGDIKLNEVFGSSDLSFSVTWLDRQNEPQRI